jgi:hypothetical protein
MDAARWASPDAPVDVRSAAVCQAAVCQGAVCQAVVCQAVVCQPGAGTEDEDEAPAGDPEYADLLDADWLDRAADARERDDDLVDVGLTLDLDERDDVDELAQGVDLDVGVLLTSLPLPVSREGAASSALNASEGASLDGASLQDSVLSDGAEAEPEIGEGSLSVGALQDVLLPEQRTGRPRAEDDDEVGDDESFPAFDSSPALRPGEPGAEDDSGGGEVQ